MADSQHRLAAIMFTDIVGYTALMGKDEQKALQILQHNRELLKPIIRQFHGEWLKEIGDGTLSSFASAIDAVKCALEVQHIFRDDPDLKLRIGIHVGDVLFDQGDVFGEGVNIASRIEPLAEPGGICVSDRVYEDLRNKPGIQAVDLGEKTLKGVNHPVKVYSLTEIRAPLAEELTQVPRVAGRKRLTPIAAVIAVVSLLAIWGTWDGNSSTEIRSIAVLPLVNLMNDPDQDYFVEGMHEALTAELSKISALRVIGRTSTMSYKDNPKPIPVIAEELNVDAVIEGSVLRDGNRVRITVQLVATRPERHLWSEDYDRELKDILNLHSDVARAIAGEIHLAITPQQSIALALPKVVDPLAFDNYIKGRYNWNKRTKKGFDSALNYYQQSLDIDPTFALAYVGLADVYTLSPFYSGGQPDEVYPLAKAAAHRALALDSTSVEALTALAEAYHYSFNQDSAKVFFEKAMSLNSNYATGFHWAGMFKYHVEHDIAGLEDVMRAQRLDPLSPTIGTNVADLLYAMRRYQEAVTQYRRVLAFAPEFWGALFGLGLTLLAQGEARSALEYLQRADHPAAIKALHVLGRTDEANELYAEFKRGFQAGERTVNWMAYASIAIGDYEQAMSQTEAAYEQRDPAMLTDLVRSPYFDPIRSNPRFKALMNAMGLAP